MTDSTGTAPLLTRLGRYQAERFPLVAYIPLMAVATFAAVAFSRAARSAGGAFPWGGWGVALLTVLVFFFFLRVLDEHKDAPDDARYRPELPVPRGLVTLRELGGAALAGLALAIALNALVHPSLLVPMAAVLAWAGFMGREFFVRDWLRARPGAYLLSHMVVMPLIFLYATSMDWLAAEAAPPPRLGAFLALAFFNGLVIEVGRKLRAPGEEREGVETYSKSWGRGVAVGVWLLSLGAAGVAAALVAAAVVHGAAAPGAPILPGMETGPGERLAMLAVALSALAALPAVLLLGAVPRGRGPWVESASGAWVLLSYALVGVASWLGGAA